MASFLGCRARPASVASALPLRANRVPLVLFRGAFRFANDCELYRAGCAASSSSQVREGGDFRALLPLLPKRGGISSPTAFLAPSVAYNFRHEDAAHALPPVLRLQATGPARGHRAWKGCRCGAGRAYGREGDGRPIGLEGTAHRDALCLYGHGAVSRMDGDGVLQRRPRVPRSGCDGLRLRGLQHDRCRRARRAGPVLAAHRAALRQAGRALGHGRVHDSVGVSELLDDLLPRARPLLRGPGRGAGGGGHRAHHPFVVGAVRLLESLPGGAVLLGRPGGRRPRSVAVQRPGHSVAVGVHLPGAGREPRLPAPRLRPAPRRRASAPVVGHLLLPVEAHRRDGSLLAGLRHV